MPSVERLSAITTRSIPCATRFVTTVSTMSASSRTIPTAQTPPALRISGATGSIWRRASAVCRDHPRPPSEPSGHTTRLTASAFVAGYHARHRYDARGDAAGGSTRRSARAAIGPARHRPVDRVPCPCPTSSSSVLPSAGRRRCTGYLDQHPRISMSKVKEPKFFLADGVRPHHPVPGTSAPTAPTWWIATRTRRCSAYPPGAGAYAGESSPYYLWDPEAAAKIKALVPEARLVAVLREPTMRAYSNWADLREQGREKLDFASAMAAEEERRQLDWEPFWFYRSLGLYGGSWRACSPCSLVHRSRCCWPRTWPRSPTRAWPRCSRFLGLEPLAGAARRRTPQPDHVHPGRPQEPGTRRHCSSEASGPDPGAAARCAASAGRWCAGACGSQATAGSHGSAACATSTSRCSPRTAARARGLGRRRHRGWERHRTQPVILPK